MSRQIDLLLQNLHIRLDTLKQTFREFNPVLIREGACLTEQPVDGPLFTQAKMSFTTCPCTSVRRKSRPA